MSRKAGRPKGSPEARLKKEGIPVAIVNLGCPKNVVDGERMAGLLSREGFKVTQNPRSAEAVIVNTCGFIEDARKESVEAILEAGGLKTRACRALVVSGCLAQRCHKDLARKMPEVDAFVGVSGIGTIPEVVRKTLNGIGAGKTDFVSNPRASLTFHPRRLSTPGHTAYLKIGDGCDNHCAYCTIPDIRGEMRSAPMEGLVKEARELARKGVRELHLVSQDSARYGEDRYGRRRIDKLLNKLADIEGIEWLRLMYLHPGHMDDELLDVIADNHKVCKYLDIPIQHISDRLLSAMNRRVTGDEIRALIQTIRKRIPGATLRTTLIAGLPGETEQEYEELLEFVEEARFDRLGVFRYSREFGTRSARMPGQVPEEVKTERQEGIMEAQRVISTDLLRKKVGRALRVLIDKSSSKGGGVGRSEGDALDIDGVVHLQGRAKGGEFVTAKITGSDEHDLYGEVVGHEG